MILIVIERVILLLALSLIISFDECGFVFRLQVGSCWRAVSMEQWTAGGAVALCSTKIYLLSQHQILRPSNRRTALAPLLWKCLWAQQFQAAQARHYRLYSHPIHLTGAAWLVYNEVKSIFQYSSITLYWNIFMQVVFIFKSYFWYFSCMVVYYTFYCHMFYCI